jgi:predicted dinucleotide-binding enzyme
VIGEVMKKKLGIIGSGGVAQTLGTAFAGKGYEVMLGTRDVAKLGEWRASVGDGGSVGSFSDAAKFGDVVILSVLGEAVLNVIELAGKENFDGKTVVDLTNPLDFSKGVPPRFTATTGNSLGEQIQRALPNARVVKAFNAIGASVMIDPKFGADTATQFIAGDDGSAKAEVITLVREFGWDVEDLGGIDQSFFLEAFASMWINYGFKYNNWTHAFKFLKK